MYFAVFRFDVNAVEEIFESGLSVIFRLEHIRFFSRLGRRPRPRTVELYKFFGRFDRFSVHRYHWRILGILRRSHQIGAGQKLSNRGHGTQQRTRDVAYQLLDGRLKRAEIQRAEHVKNQRGILQIREGVHRTQQRRRVGAVQFDLFAVFRASGEITRHDVAAHRMGSQHHFVISFFVYVLFQQLGVTLVVQPPVVIENTYLGFVAVAFLEHIESFLVYVQNAVFGMSGVRHIRGAYVQHRFARLRDNFEIVEKIK